MRKRITSLFLVLALCLSLLPTTAFAEDTSSVAREARDGTGVGDVYTIGEDTILQDEDGSDEAVQALIDALPEDVTADNAEELSAQLAAIDEALAPLTDEQLSALDMTRYEALCAVLAALTAEQADGHTDHALCQHTGTCSCPADAKNSDAFTGAKALTYKSSVQNGNTYYNLCINGVELESNYNGAIEYFILPAGNYYLAEDVTLSYAIRIQSGETVNLCLNGHTITKTSESGPMEGVVVVQPASQFTLCDCKTGGTITHKDGVTGRGVRVGSTNALVPQASFIMYGGSISGNKLDSQSGGGGVELHNASFRMYDGEISGNHAGNSGGGGVYAHDSSKIFLYGGTISGNTSNSSGGGISTVASTFEMHGGEITGNTAAMDGGGAELWNDSFALSGGKISGNTASNGNGGGVFYSGLYNGEMLTISDTMKIEGNSAVDGGGIYINKRSLMVTGGSISNNTVTGSGGGVYFGGDTFLVSGGVSIAGNKQGGTDNNVYLPGGKVINVAFAVPAAFVFGDHLGFTAGFAPDMIAPMIVGKLTGGILAAALAFWMTKGEANGQK